MPSKVVMAVGTAVHATRHGAEVGVRLQQAMSDAVAACNAEGITCDEANTPVIRARMQAAYDRTLAEIEAERHREE